VPQVTLDYSDPFGHGVRRPYLSLHFTGINQASGAVIGLLDTGADTTALPNGYASLMGYQSSQLERVEVGTAGGASYAWQAKAPCIATVVGATPPELTLSLRPAFVESATPLWGRGDVMRLFALTIEDANECFTLAW
jgi:hypothetical protein